ncbi:MAG: outer membrane protein assembly factor BamA [Planctomycetota bacterium]
MKRCRPLVLGLVLGGCTVLPDSFIAKTEQGSEGVPVEVDFEGVLGWFSRSPLLRAVEPHMIDLSAQPERSAAAYDAKLELEDLYRGQGYPDVEVTFEIEKHGTGEDRRLLVRFEVDSGPRVLVERVELLGNRDLRTKDLLLLWERKLSGFLGMGKPLFVKSEIDAFANAIRARYLSQGYLAVEVEDPEVERSEDRSKAAVRIRIREGARFKLGKLEIDEELRRAFGSDLPEFPTGQFFSMRDVEEYAISLYRILRNRGYPEPHLLRAGRVAQEAATADVLIRGDPGMRSRVAEVQVKGNVRTLDHVILSKIDLKKGDWFIGDREDEAKRSLDLTGLFRRVDVKHEKVSEGWIRVVFNVEEGSTGAIDIEFPGYGSYQGLHGLVRVSDLNFLGTGVAASLEGRLSKRGYLTEAAIHDPSFFSSDTEFELSGDFLRRQQPSFTDRSVGLTTAFSRAISESVSGRLGYRFRSRLDSTVKAIDPASNLTDFEMGSVFTELRLDARASPLLPGESLLPESGHREFLSFEFVDDSLGGELSFLRSQLRTNAFLKLGSHLGVVLSGHAGWLWPLEGSAQVPIQERYFNGGEDSVRSFRQDKLGPRDVNGNPVGGEYRNTFTLEFLIQPRGPLGIALFADAGNVGRNVHSYGFSKMRYAIGTGFRAGPFRFDAAFNPDQEPGDESWVFHFSMRHTF